MASPREDSVFVYKHRLEKGLCPYCGSDIRKVEVDPITKIRRSEPLTIHGIVLHGRCLLCYPLPDPYAVAVPPFAAVPAMEPPAQVLGVSPAAVTAASDDDDDCRSDDAAMVQPEHVPSAAANVSPVAEPPRRWGLGHRAARSDAAGDRKRARRHSRSGCSDQDDSEGGFVPLPFTATAEEDDDSTSSTDQKRNGNGRTLKSSKERSTSPQGILVTPGFRNVSEEDSVKAGPAKKMKVASLIIYDEHRQEFRGHVITGNCERGSGRFEHTHEDDDDDLNGNVTIYEGEFSGGMFEGEGKLLHARGTVYEGQFEKGSPNGYGTCDWPDGWRYVGDWRQDERHGKGRRVQISLKNKKVLENGEQYEGDWYKDTPHGQGKLKFNGGGYAKGSFREGELHGEAEYHFKDGSVYRGSFLAGLRSGQGRMMYADGSTYEGQWRDNKRHGDGTFSGKDGCVFKGTFKNEIEYDGVISFLNGDEERIVKGKRRNK